MDGATRRVARQGRSRVPHRTDDVEEAPQHRFADGHGHRGTRRRDLDAAGESGRRLQRDRADGSRIDVAMNLEGEGLRQVPSDD